MPKKKLNPSNHVAVDIPLQLTPISDSVRVAELFTVAFRDDSLTQYLTSIAKDAKSVMGENFRLVIERTYVNGVVFRTSENYEGAAVWFLAGFPKSNLRSNWKILLFKLNQFRLHDISKVIPFYLKIEKAHIRNVRQPHYYLELLGVDPKHQGKGFASQLMRPILAHADAHHRLCYLETETQKNIAMYEHYGFKVIEKISSTFSSETYHLMLRKPV